MKIKHLAGVFIALAAMFLVACGGVPLVSEPATAQGLMTVNKVIDPTLIETRYCGAPKRDTKGAIIRRADVVTAFRADNVCPATGLTTGKCTDWQVDHVKPLDNGGCDAVWNMQWLPIWLKTCAGYCKDRWERKINCRPVSEGGTGCVNSVIAPPPK